MSDPADTSSNHRPWTVAAVSVTALGFLLLLRAVGTGQEGALLPLYVATYALTGLCMFGPAIKAMGYWQLLMFFLPGAAMVALWMLDTGYWGGLWLIGLPAWALLCTRWPTYGWSKRGAELGGFAVGMASAGVLLVLSIYLPNPAVFLLPFVPLARFWLSNDYRGQLAKFIIETLLPCAVVAVALSLPVTDWTWPPGMAGAVVLPGLLLALWAGRKSNTVRGTASERSAAGR